MVRIKAFESALRLPDFNLIRDGEMLANPHHGLANPLSIVPNFLRVHPFQPEWPAYPLALIKDLRLEKYPKTFAELRTFDDEFWRVELADARARGREARLVIHHLEDVAAAERYDEHKLTELARGRVHFFKVVKEIMVSREKGHHKARKLQLALFDYIRRHSQRVSKKEMVETHRLIVRAFTHHAQVLAWRLDNLYSMNGTHGYSRQKHGGFTLEHVLGTILWELRHAMSLKYHEWRQDDQYAIGPNGGIVHLHRLGGQHLEHVSSQAHMAKLAHHRELTRVWHDTNSVIHTPNGGLLHARHQGVMPELGRAQAHEPVIHQRALLALQWHLSQMLESLPNGGYIHAPRAAKGRSPERVTGDTAWAQKRIETHHHWEWRKSNLSGPTSNGGYAPLKGHGLSEIQVTADADRPKRARATHGFNMWHATHMFAETPNHAFAPLKGHGRPLAAVAAESNDHPRARAKAGTELWHATHRFKETPNHGYAPLKTLGGTFEHISSDFTKRIKDAVTRHMLERRLDNLYTPAANGTFRRLGHVGKSLEHVSGVLAKPDEGPGALKPLPSSGGHVYQSAETRVATETHNHKASEVHLAAEDHQRKVEADHLKRSVREFQRNLAAHEHKVSQLRGHVTTAQTEAPRDPDQTTGPRNATGAAKLKKA